MLNNRTLIISDIHGCYKEFTQLLELVEYDPIRDKVIFLGDYVSRGPSSKEVVELVINLVKKHGAIALQGNHDHRFVRVLEGVATEEELNRFFEMGGHETLRSYCDNNIPISKDFIHEIRDNMKQYSAHISFLKNLPYYYEENQYIFVHAGVNPNIPNLSNQNTHDLLYIKEEFYTNKAYLDKIVIFGHTITVDIHGKPDIWIADDKIGIDGGCAFGYQLNCLEIIEGKIINTYHIKAIAS